MRALVKILFRYSTKPSPVYSSGRSLFQISQLWDGNGQHPADCFVRQSVACESGDEQTDLKRRVLYQAKLLSPSMKINVNDLLGSPTLNSLIQLSASRKERLIDYPSTVVINPSLEGDADHDRIGKNMLELDKLFRDAVGLKLAYLIDKQGLGVQSFISEMKKREKALSADVVETGAKLEDVIFEHGYRLQHIFLDGLQEETKDPQGFFIHDFDLNEVLSALNSIGFKGKIIVPSGARGEAALELISEKAREVGFSKELNYKGSQTWHDMV